MSTPVVHDPSGFELPDGQRRLILWTLLVGFAAVGIGVLNGLGQALNYAGVDILQYFPGMRNYYQGLTVHGVFNAIVFTFAFANGFLALTTARGLGRPLRQGLLAASLGSLLLGTLLAAFAMFSGRASVLYTFYPPLGGHWTFYLGLALVVVSTWITSLSLFLALRDWKRENPGTRIPLMAYISVAVYVMWDIASLGIAIEVVVLLLPWSLGLIAGADPLLSRTLFWYTGHPIVYFWLLPAYVSWYLMVPKHAGGVLFSDTMVRMVFILFIVLSIPVGFHHQFSDPGVREGFKAIHATLTFGVFFPSMVTAFTVMYALEVGGRRRGGKGLVAWFFALDWKHPPLVAQLLAMLAFMLGGITGLINASFNLNQMIHNTTWVPGHFHLTVGTAVTLSFFGIAYWVFPYLTGRALFSRNLALASSWLYFVGVLVMARGLISGGLEAMPRRTWLLEATYGKPEWELAGLLTGAGGTLMFLGAAAFFVVLGGTLLRGSRETTHRDLPFTVTFEPPARQGVAASLDRFWLWAGFTAFLIVLAYGPFMVEYLPPKLLSPPYAFF